MIAAVADTHRRKGHGLEGRTREAVREAAVVAHAGDFTTGAVLEAFRGEAARLEAVFGNNDDAAVRDALPGTRVFAAAGLRIALVHGHEHGETALSLLARQEAADLVIVGHSHRPAITDLDGALLLNPGSHAQPRGFRPAHAELEREAGGVVARLVEPDGTVFERVEVGGRT